jgi:hypothetical protein
MSKVKSIKPNPVAFTLLYDLALEVCSTEETNPAMLGELKFLANETLQKINNNNNNKEHA